VTADEQSRGSARAARGPAVTLSRLLVPSAEWICFYDDNYHPVVRFLMHNGASQSDAEDAAHDAFIVSYEMATNSPDRWHAVTCKAGWIRAVALRKCRRPPGPRRRPLVTGDEVPELPTLDPGPEDLAVQTQLVLKALLALDEEARAVIAFDIDGIPAADIARQLEITPQRVRDVRKKARTILKHQLGRNQAFGGGKQA
jgi:RNA polymerase sigma factor (sigma-70 family)